MIHWLEVFGMAIFSITAALMAGRKKMDVFGVVLIAVVTGVGGGTIRDLILDVRPIYWLKDQTFIYIAMITALITFGIVHFMPLAWRFLMVCDALGLAVFTVVGCQKAMAAGTSPVITIIMGMMTGVAGGVLRDVLCDEMPSILRSELYATASLIGGVIFVGLLRLHVPEGIAAVPGMASIFIIRLAAMHWSIRLPVLDLDKTRVDPSEMDVYEAESS